MENNPFELYLVKQKEQQLNVVLECNEFTEKFGLRLSKEEVLTLLENKRNVLKQAERLELSEGILNKLIFAFCDSPFIYHGNYYDTLDALQSMFYYYKNESLDMLTDNELIEFMKEHFDGDCMGSLEYLEDTILDQFCRGIRKKRDD